jgi:phosphoglycolate phosphatase-like HAD superfamily hydrolase
VARYVIFDLDDTLVHSDAVREAFAFVADTLGVCRARMRQTLDRLPGRPAVEIFVALGLSRASAREAADGFLALLAELDERVPTVAYPDADATVRALAAQGSTLMLSTGSPPERARKVLDQEGWHAFSVVLGSRPGCRKGPAHYAQMGAAAPNETWAQDAITVGDSPADMRLAAEHGVPVRIGIARDRDPHSLRAAGATHVVHTLADILPILAAAA